MAYSTPRISHNRAIGHSLRTIAFLHIDDYANTPPAHALANRQIIENVTGYTVYGDYSAARIIDAVAAGEVDVAIVRGP
jgi:mxaJ protein